MLQAAGVRLKELIGDETVSFYVSPFVRSKETYTCIREHFSEDQVHEWYSTTYHHFRQDTDLKDPTILLFLAGHRVSVIRIVDVVVFSHVFTNCYSPR